MSKLGVATWPFIVAVLAKANGEPLSTGEVGRRASEMSHGKCTVLKQHVSDELDRLGARGLVNNLGQEKVRNGWVITDAGRKTWSELCSVLGPVFGGVHGVVPTSSDS